MKSVILGDARMDYLQDVSTSLMLDSYPVNVTPVKSIEDVYNKAARQKDAIIVLSSSLLPDYDAQALAGRTVYGYAAMPNDIDAFVQAGIPCIGLCKTSSSLLNIISQNTIPVMQAPAKHQSPPTQPVASAPQQPAPETPQVSQEPAAPQGGTPTPTQPTVPTPIAAPAGGQMPVMTPEMIAWFQSMMMQGMNGMGQPAQATTPATAPSSAPVATPVQTQPPVEEEHTAAQPVTDQNPQFATAGQNMRDKKAQAAVTQLDQDIENDLLVDAMNKVRKTKTITVYAAKGGVGKTTIASELATCLALTSNGRRKFRVCLVDYNIDFGDVATTLALDEHGPNMTYWANEIKELLKCGKTPETTRFTRSQMETNYLQCCKDTGLYVLAAPIMHEDSMYITAEELEVMLDSIIECGEFDFVICDTGNNTRDSSVTALDRSDYVLLVATQDVTTANCNTAVLKTLRDTGFDTTKVRLILNNVMPSRETGISVAEVEETIPYKCLCRIKRTADIIRANNEGQPLVYKPNHEYTKQIQRIVHFVCGEDVPDLDDDPEKRGLFAKLFGK